MIVPRIEGFNQLVEVLRSKANASREEDDVRVVVGYTANYAIYVHENLEAIHPTGQAKFLETPSRQLQRVFAQIIIDAKRRGRTLAQGLLMAGLRLQRESQALCPVLTGTLRNSAFTRLDERPR